MKANEKKQVNECIAQLDTIRETIENLQGDIEERFDNMSDSAQESERGERIQQEIDYLEEAAYNIQEALDQLNEMMEG